MLRKTIIIILALAAVYGGLWFFNHVNAWLGIAVIVIVAYDAISFILSTLKKQKKDEK